MTVEPPRAVSFAISTEMTYGPWGLPSREDLAVVSLPNGFHSQLARVPALWGLARIEVGRMNPGSAELDVGSFCRQADFERPRIPREAIPCCLPCTTLGSWRQA